MEGGLASPEMNGTPNNGTNKKETVYQGANWKKNEGKEIKLEFQNISCGVSTWLVCTCFLHLPKN